MHYAFLHKIIPHRQLKNDHIMTETLKDKTARGLFWGMMNSGTTQVLNLVIGIMLGRLLSPDDWGLVGMLAIFSALAGNIQSSGFSTAIVNMKAPTERDYNAVFWFNILTSIAIYLLLFACATLIAQFFHQPQLAGLSRVVFLSFLISSFGISTNAYMTKNMMNKEITIVSFVALVTSGTVAVIMAYRGFAYWSLAWQQVINSTMLVVGRFICVEWKPALRFDFSPIRKTFRFSMNILATTIINTVNANILTFIFGRVYGRHVTGNFFQANKWNTMASSLVSGMLDQVAQPVLVSLRDDNDKAREVRAFRKLLRFTSFLAFPAMFGLALIGHEFIIITITEKWIESVLPLQILCVGGAFLPFYSLYRNLIISHGQSDINMWLNIGQVVLQLLLIILLRHYGFIAMVLGYSTFNILWLGAWQYYAHRMTGLRLTDVFKDILPFLAISLGVMTVTWLVTHPITNMYILLCSRIIIAAALYLTIMKLAHAVILQECIDFILHRKRR